MKKIILPLLMMIFANNIFAASYSVEINGNLKNNNYYDSIYISPFIRTENSIYKAAIDASGKFNLKINNQGTDFYRMWLDDKNFVLLILSPGETVKFEADATDLFNSFSTEGSYHTGLFYEANKEFSKFAFVRDSLKEAFSREMDLIEMKERAFALNYVKKNYKSITSLMYIDKVDKDLYLDVYKMVDSALIIEYPTNKLVNDFHQEVKKMSHLAIGTEVPEIELTNAVGEKVALSSLRGKVVLIDFWATWCGPCKAEMPNVRRTYEMFRNKGFEVYSISIDKEKSKWLEFQKDLPWINVHDSNGSVAQEFSVMSIPFTILVGRDGKIISKNLRGNDLPMQVNDALNN